jgi:hypothetical protein
LASVTRDGPSVADGHACLLLPKPAADETAKGVEPECIGPHDPPSTDAQKTTDVSSVSVALSRPVGRATLHVRRKRSHSLCTRATCRRSCRGWPVRYIGRLRERSAGWAARSVSFLTASPPSRTLTSSGQLVLARQAPWERLGGGTTFCGPPGWPLSCPFLEPMSPSGRATAVAAVQDILGDHQDTVVAEAWWPLDCCR